MALRLAGAHAACELELPGLDNRCWLPGEINGEAATVQLPENLPPGTYQVLVGMFEPGKDGRRMVELGLKNDLREADGFYRVAVVEVTDQML